MSNHAAPDQTDIAAIQAQVLHGIAGNRIPGLHFPGYFLDIALPRMQGDSVDMRIACAPYTRDAGGTVDLTALCLLADSSLATSTRNHIAAGARLATLHLQMQFTGLPASATVHSHAHAAGVCHDTAVRQLMATATLKTAAGIVCHASGEFAALDPPPGVKLAPLPWQLDEPPQPAALKAGELTAEERPLFNACKSALRKAAKEAAFIQHFWGSIPRRTVNGARARFAIGPHLTNRVGHVQGGISVGIAARCACVAAPAHMLLSNISACYISPGRGKALVVKSRVVHAGKTIAVVRTEVKTDSGARVLDVVTHHVARKHA